MCFSSPKPQASKPAPVPQEPPKPLENEALRKKRSNRDQVSRAREGLKIPIGTGQQGSGLGIPRG